MSKGKESVGTAVLAIFGPCILAGLVLGSWAVYTSHNPEPLSYPLISDRIALSKSIGNKDFTKEFSKGITANIWPEHVSVDYLDKIIKKVLDRHIIK